MKFLSNCVGAFLLCLLFGCVFISGQDCGVGNHSSPLILEHELEDEFPWMVKVQWNRTLPHGGNTLVDICSGFLIDRRHFLTSMNCFTKEPLGQSQYSIQHYNIATNEYDSYDVVQIQSPDGFVAHQLIDDIALVRVDRDVAHAQPLCLFQDGEDDLAGKVGTFVGYGFGAIQSLREGGDTKMYADRHMKIMQNSDCNEQFETELDSDHFKSMLPQGISMGMLCGKTPFGEGNNEEYCLGIGGATLMIHENSRWYAVGINTFSMGCYPSAFPDGFTRVPSYVDWINTKLALYYGL